MFTKSSRWLNPVERREMLYMLHVGHHSPIAKSFACTGGENEVLLLTKQQR